MTSNSPSAPSAEEITAAQDVLARLALANKARIDAKLPALRALVGKQSFASLLKAVTQLHEDLPEGTPFRSHLAAVVVGMTNLQNDLQIA